jgi:hypothetical protein
LPQTPFYFITGMLPESTVSDGTPTCIIIQK